MHHTATLSLSDHLVAKRSSVPRMRVCEFPKHPVACTHIPRHSPRRYLHRRDWDRYSWMDLQHRSHSVLRPFVSDTVVYLLECMSDIPPVRIYRVRLAVLSFR